MQKLKKIVSSYTFNISLIIGIAIVVIHYTLKDSPVTLKELFENANWWWIIFIACMVVSIRFLSGYAIKEECNLTVPEYTLKNGADNSFTAGFFNAITPSSTGGQFAQIYVFKKQGIPFTTAAGVLWMDFILYQSTLVITSLLLLILRFHTYYVTYSNFFMIVVFGFIVNAAVIVGLFALVKFPKFYTWLTTKGLQIGCKLKLVKDKEKAERSLEEQLERFQGEVDVLSNNRAMVIKVVTAHFLRLTIYYLIPYFCALALHVNVPNHSLIDIIALSSFVASVNAFIPLPGASGGTEVSFVLMFSTIFGKANAAMIMLLWRFSSYYLDLLIGALVFLKVKLRDKDRIEVIQN